MAIIQWKCGKRVYATCPMNGHLIKLPLDYGFGWRMENEKHIKQFFFTSKFKREDIFILFITIGVVVDSP